MELKFEELNLDESTFDELNFDESNLVLEEPSIVKNYWENTNTNTNTKQKQPQISYDDILSSLNMVVQNGVLKFSNPAPIKKKQVTIVEPTNYITNKYFKDFKDGEEEKKPLTREKYRQLYIKQQQDIKRISEIKSKKLLFNTQNISISPSQNPVNLNRLFPMFKR